MWTPKRVLMLSTGVAVFLAGFFVYSFFLGSIDTLPPLPERLLSGTGPNPNPVLETGLSDIDRKLQQAFGPQCLQINRSVKFEIRKHDLVVAADEASFKEPDGRVKLKDFSVAIFKFAKDAKQFPEITTVTSNFAFLTFDQPIQNPTDMSKAKIIGGELRGKITVINNHSTAERSDDLEVLIENEPLFYDDRAGRIWSNGVVLIIDKQNKPHPNKISGKELEIFLVKEDPKDKKQPPPGTAPKPKSDLNGVQSMTLKSMVEMHLYTDSGSGFLASTQGPTIPSSKQENSLPKNPTFPSIPGPLNPGFLFEKPVVKEPPKSPEKSHIKITTFGSFTFDVPKDVARFDSPPVKPGFDFPDQVQVLRELVRDKNDPKVAVNYDHLVCDHLMLKFRRRGETPGTAKGDGPGANREIESAHASARPGGEIVLALDSEALDCHCQELIYHSATNERGARTELRGEPLCAVKDGHQLHARGLILEAANQKGATQRIFAQGPGQIDLCDRNPEKGFTTHAVWKGQLSSIKAKVGEREITELTFTEDAAFLDDERKWTLKGQTLVIRLEQVEAAAKSTFLSSKQDPTVGGSRQQPTRVEAYDNVTADSAELHISDCKTLKVNFRSPLRTEPTASSPAQSPSAGQPTGVLPGLTSPKSPATASAVDPKSKDREKAKKPIDLRASTVDVDVLRTGEKHDLQEVVATGNVRVLQEGEKPGVNGVNIKGHELNLRHSIEGQGDVLVVYGNDKGPGQLLLSDLLLIGPEVTIDQKQNIAKVRGGGAMTMPSNTTFQGGKPNKPTYITVHFTKDMFFNGRDAEFNGDASGGVTACQDNSELRCQQLVVELDRPVSLKQGQKEGQAAKVEKVLAHNDARDAEHYVTVADITKDAMDKVIKQSQMWSRELFVDMPENKVQGFGPGMIQSLQLGTPEGIGSDKGGKHAKDGSKQQQLMLSRVIYRDRMTTIEQSKGVRRTVFLGGIDVFHFPAQSLNEIVEQDKLPKGAFWLKCEKLIVQSRQLADGKTAQIMEAGDNNVRCQTIDMHAVAERIIFDETKDEVTLYGSKGNPAVIHKRVSGPGSGWQTTTGASFMYNRKTGAIRGGEVSSIGGR